jgi:hemoglobin
MADDSINLFFDGVRMPRQIFKQKIFLTMAFGGPSKYDGKNLREAHKHLVEDKGLNEEHFVTVTGHLQASLEELNVPNPFNTRSRDDCSKYKR